jgi:hypothetical protein
VDRHVRRIVLGSVAAGVAVFLGVQDRVTAGGARRYVDLHAAARVIPPSQTVDDIMGPAVARSVRIGGLAGSGVTGLGLLIAAVIARRSEGG